MRTPKHDEEQVASPWIEQLMEAVSGCWEWHALALHIGIQYRGPEDENDCWEVWVYPAMQEIVGGENDGETGWSGFNFDLSGLLKKIEANSLDLSSGMADPAEVVVDGEFLGQPVLLHVCLEPPDDVEATEIINVTRPEGPTVSEKG
jgi:hypothetical protein